jgi:hypothetical protein
MSLASLLSRKSDEVTEGESLPEYMNRLNTPSRPKFRDIDVVANVLEEHRRGAAQEREERDVYEMLRCIRGRRVDTHEPEELTRQHRISKIEGQLQLMEEQYD